MSRRRRTKNRREKKATLVCVLALLFSILVSLSISEITGKFSTNAFVITFIVCAVLFGAASIVLSLPVVKGKIGEKRVSNKLNKLAKKYGGQVFNDITIQGENDKTSQIDHIYVCNYGVFVVETKNYAGRIYGNESQLEWTQVLMYGRSKNKLYNPVKQNQTHIYRLKELLGLDVNFESVVVFIRADITNVNSDYVYELRDLKHLLDDAEKTIDDLNLSNIVTAVAEYKANPAKSNKEHVQEIKQMKADIDNNICPRCGAPLVLRNGSRGAFYGCSNYPKCRFIKK